MRHFPKRRSRTSTDSNGELLAAAIQELGNELVEHIEERVTSISILSGPLALLDLDANSLIVRTHARFKKHRRRSRG